MSNGGTTTNIGTKAPYAPPCGGWSAVKKFLFGCGNEKNKVEDGKTDAHPDGWPVYKNTTLVPSLNPDGTFNYALPVAPYPLILCGGQMSLVPPDCSLVTEICPRVVNTYALKDPPEFFTPSVCKHTGRKFVLAAKSFHGMYGFNTNINYGTVEAPNWNPPVNGTKYLTKTIVGSLTIEELDNDGNVTRTVTGTVSRTISVDRYSGKLSVSGCSETYSDTLDPDPPPNPIGRYDWGGEFSADYQNNQWNGDPGGRPFNDPAYPFHCYIHFTHSVSPTELYYKLQADTAECLTHCPEDCPPDNGRSVLEVRLTLSNPYSYADLRADRDTLHATWDQCNDAQIPWSTGDVTSGPLVTYDEKGPTSPNVFLACDFVDSACPTGAIRGAPTDIGREAFWDSKHRKLSLRDTGGNELFCWFPDSIGAFSPFPHATQWTEDFTFEILPWGGYTAYNSPQMILPNGGPEVGTGCGVDGQYRAGQLVSAKYAEIILYEKPSQNKARPCGKTDRETRDPDTIDCDSNPLGNLRWPDAPCYCNDPTSLAPADECGAEDKTLVLAANDAGNKGSFSVKVYSFDEKSYSEAAEPKPHAGSLVAMECHADCLKKANCAPAAVFIQNEPLTGKYLQTGKRYALPDCDIYDGTTPDGATLGYLKLVQVHQHMVDPLWKHPANCIDGIKTPDPDAIIPYVENTNCADGNCTGYVAYLNAGGAPKANCEPAPATAPKPWDA